MCPDPCRAYDAWMDSEEKALADGGVSQAVSVRERPLTYDTQISMSGV